MGKHGISAEYLEIIKNILKLYAENIDKVGLFGSRATGTYSDNSDIDMVIYGNIEETAIDRIWTLFEDSNMSVSIDVNAYNLIDYQPLKAHIDDVMITIFTRKDLM